MTKNTGIDTIDINRSMHYKNQVKEAVMNKSIEIPASLYQRLSSHAEGFETPATVIERLLNSFEGQEATEPTINIDKKVSLPISLEIIFYPNEEESFKKELLEKKIAYLLLHKIDGTKEIKEWSASNFQPHSSVSGNLRSGYLRGWKNKGIVKAEISTNKNDLL